MDYSFFSPELLSFAVKGDFCYHCPLCNSRLSASFLSCRYKADHVFEINGQGQSMQYVYLYFVKQSIYYQGTIYPFCNKTNIYARSKGKVILNTTIENFVPESVHSLIDLMETYALFS